MMRCYDSCSTASCKVGDSNTNTRKTGGRDILGDQPVSAEKEVGGKMGKRVARAELGGLLISEGHRGAKTSAGIISQPST